MGLIALGGAMLAGSCACFISIQQDMKKRSLTMERLRTTRLFTSVQPMLMRHRGDVIESVTIHPDSLTVRTLIPVGGSSRFTYERHHVDQPGQDTLYALAVTVAGELPALGNAEHYTMHRHEDRQADGTMSSWYEYMINPGYRRDVMRHAAREQAAGKNRHPLNAEE